MTKNRTKQPKISHESEADVLTWELTNKNIYSAKEIGSVIVHFTKNDTPVLIEILEASKFFSHAGAVMHKEKKPTVRKICV